MKKDAILTQPDPAAVVAEVAASDERFPQSRAYEQGITPAYILPHTNASSSTGSGKCTMAILTLG